MPAARSNTFSVVIPLYNHVRFIEAAIDSVLAQTRQVDEILVIDDGSVDGGFEVASRLLSARKGAQVLRQQNIGAHNTINRCVELSNSEYIAVLNSDDVFSPGKIDRCAELIAARPVDLIFGGADLIDENGHAITVGQTVEWLKRAKLFLEQTGLVALSLLNENFAISTSNMVFSRTLWQRNGKFQPLRYCHDLDFLLTSARNGRVMYDSDQRHISYRVHSGNTIKETLTRIRIEIAAVLVTVLCENKLGLIEDAGTQFGIAAIASTIKSKNLSDLALTLLPIYLASPSRGAFYTQITSEQCLGLYSKILEGAVDLAERSEQAAAGRSVVHGRSALPIVMEVLSFDKGGLEKVVLDSAFAMKGKGIDPLIVSVGNIGHLADVAARGGVEVIKLPSSNRDMFYKTLLRVRNIKLCVSHFSRAGYALCKELDIPNITFIHNVYAMLGDDAVMHFKMDDRCVAKYISVSKNATRYAVRKLGISAAKIITVANGLIIQEHLANAEGARPIDRETLKIESGDYVFLNVASYNLHKGHYLMATAMEIIRSRRDDIRIVCIGNEVYPPHVKELKNYLTARKLNRHIIMPGYIANVAPFHLMSDAFILPSFIEGWSIAMNEAMFYQKPMLLSNTGAAGEVIEDNDIGMIVQNEYGELETLDSRLLDELAYSPRAYKTAPILAERMMEFADNRQHWKLAGLNGRKKVLERYDFATIVDAYINIFEQVIAEPR
jgi:glycosyltransferase involved in cell wall biosynthesis